MSQFFNLQNLFQRPLVPIGNRDKEELGEIYQIKDGKDQGFTHWLLALLWHEDESCAGWKVVVFPVGERRVFWLVPPLFYTSSPSSFENAWKLSEAIKECSGKDRITEKFVNPYWDNWSELEAIFKEVKACST